MDVYKQTAGFRPASKICIHYSHTLFLLTYKQKSQNSYNREIQMHYYERSTHGSQRKFDRPLNCFLTAVMNEKSVKLSPRTLYIGMYKDTVSEINHAIVGRITSL